jgi:hypothetical protein
VLAGNSVHVDRTFLAEEMPEIVDWLHYRIVGKPPSLPTLLGGESDLCIQRRLVDQGALYTPAMQMDTQDTLRNFVGDGTQTKLPREIKTVHIGSSIPFLAFQLRTKTKHCRALDDIRGSIRGNVSRLRQQIVPENSYLLTELKWYRENIFVSPN